MNTHTIRRLAADLGVPEGYLAALVTRHSDAPPIEDASTQIRHEAARYLRRRANVIGVGDASDARLSRELHEMANQLDGGAS